MLRPCLGMEVKVKGVCRDGGDIPVLLRNRRLRSEPCSTRRGTPAPPRGTLADRDPSTGEAWSHLLVAFLVRNPLAWMTGGERASQAPNSSLTGDGAFPWPARRSHTSARRVSTASCALPPAQGAGQPRPPLPPHAQYTPLRRPLGRGLTPLPVCGPS